jgi:hypothetical protein
MDRTYRIHYTEFHPTAGEIRRSCRVGREDLADMISALIRDYCRDISVEDGGPDE